MEIFSNANRYLIVYQSLLSCANYYSVVDFGLWEFFSIAIVQFSFKYQFSFKNIIWK